MFFANKDPLAKVKSALKTQDIHRIASAITEVVEAHGYVSEIANDLSRVLEQNQVVVPHFVQKFCANNPNLLSTAQLTLAAYYCQIEQYEMGTSEARSLLRRILASDLFKSADAPAGLKDMAARALVTMTAVYTQAGARSYSLRLLKRALEVSPGGAQTEFIGNEMTTLRNELDQPSAAALDAKWEAFFERFENSGELYAHCEALGFDLLARRIDLLETNARFNANFKIGPDEALLEVYETKPDDEGKISQLLR